MGVFEFDKNHILNKKANAYGHNVKRRTKQGPYIIIISMKKERRLKDR